MTPERTLLITRVITGAMMTSVILYNLAFYVLLLNWTEAPVAEEESMHWALAGCGVLLYVLAAFVPSIIAKLQPAGSASTMQVYLVTTVVRLALQEAAAIVGFAISFLTHNDTWLQSFSIATLIAMSFYWPRADYVQQILQKQRS